MKINKKSINKNRVSKIFKSKKILGGSNLSNNSNNEEEKYQKEQKEVDKYINELGDYLTGLKIIDKPVEVILDENKKIIIVDALKKLVEYRNTPKIRTLNFESDVLKHLINLNEEDAYQELAQFGVYHGDIVLCVNNENGKTEYIYQVGNNDRFDNSGKREKGVRGYWAWPQPDTKMPTDINIDGSNSENN